MNCPADLRTGPAAGRPRTAPAPALTPALTMFFSATVGVIVLNLFAAQPLTGPIAAELRLPASLTGLVAMLPQLGYAAGLVLLVPLVDLLENRRLIVTTLAVCAATLALPAVTRSGAVYLAAVFAAGAASSVIQMLVPMAASMAPDERRGRAVGNVMSGLMLGILLSRPLASLIAGAAGWRAFYGAAAAADIAIAAVLAAKLPLRAPQLSTRYAALLRSLWTLVATERVLQRRALSAALSMAAFSAFWTAIGLRLAAAPFDLGLHGIAMFAFAGATGAIVTPFAGLAGDRGRERDALRGAHVAMLAALAALGVAGPAGADSTRPRIRRSRSRCSSPVRRRSTRASSPIRRSAGARSICSIPPCAGGSTGSSSACSSSAARSAPCSPARHGPGRAGARCAR